MKMFLFGFLSCWILLAIIAFIRDSMNFGSKATDVIDIILMLPIAIIVCPINILYLILQKQWQNVRTPVPISRWNNLLDKYDALKYLKIKNFYICFDKKARLINKLFFVRITNAEDKGD